MSNNTIARLAAANPVPDPPSVEPAERLRCLIEAEVQSVRTGTGRGRVRGNATRALAVAAVALAASFTGLVLSDGSSSPGVNIAAAAYAATSARGRVVEARFVERMRLPHGRVVRYGHREWLDAATGIRRDRRVVPAALIRGAVQMIDELATSPRWLETWSSSEADVVRRVLYSFRRVPNALRHSLLDAHQRAAGVGVGQAAAGIEAFRRLYREQPLKLIGRERWHGRWLWKLEGYVAFASHSADSKLVPLMAEVVLVDPRTYLPVVQRQVLLATHSRRVEAEDELVGYRRLPAGVASEALLKVDRQHPHARVLVERPAELRRRAKPPRLPRHQRPQSLR